MKKYITGFAILLISLCLAACQSSKSDDRNLSTYQTISLSEVEQKIQQEEDFFLYVGRPTCPHCRSFAPQLEKAIQTTQAQVYYLNTDEEDAESIQNFARSASIQTVPHLAYYKEGGKVRFLEKGSEASLSEIEDFLKNTN